MTNGNHHMDTATKIKGQACVSIWLQSLNLNHMNLIVVSTESFSSCAQWWSLLHIHFLFLIIFCSSLEEGRDGVWEDEEEIVLFAFYFIFFLTSFFRLSALKKVFFSIHYSFYKINYKFIDNSVKTKNL